MLIKKYIVWSIACVSGIPCIIIASNPLSPTTPVVIINNGSVNMPVVVANNSAGFMTMAVSNGDRLQSSFSADNGATWVNDDPIFENAYLPMWVGANSQGFMATWVGPDIGYTTLNAEWTFSSNNGSTWSPNPAGSILATPSLTIFSPVVVWGSDAGFMATWRDNNGSDAYATFTNDNGTSWSTPVNISNTTLVASAVMVTSTADGFIATYTQNDNNAYATVTSNNGGSWGDPVTIVNTGDVITDTWVASNGFGIIATWVDNEQNGCSSTSVDNGTTWSAPLEITSNIANCCDVSVVGIDGGFVAAWVGSDNNAYASFLGNGADAWTDSVAITTDGSVSLGEAFLQENGQSFVGIAARNDPGVLFAWLGNDNNTYASFSSINLIQPPTNFAGIQKQNNFGLVYELFNTLTWQASSSTDVVGYKLYRNNVLIASLNGSTTIYQDHNQPRGVAITYSLVAVDAEGDTSTPITITVS